MSQYSEFFLNSDSNVVELELVEISHPSFTHTYRTVRNALDGVIVTLEDGLGIAAFDYYPLKLTPTGATDDLDQSISVQLGDLGEQLPMELDLINAADTFAVKPTLLLRIYRSDDLSAPIEGPIRFKVTDVAMTNEGAALNAGAPRLNMSSTGRIYRMDDFVMLRGFM